MGTQATFDLQIVNTAPYVSPNPNEFYFIDTGAGALVIIYDGQQLLGEVCGDARMVNGLGKPVMGRAIYARRFALGSVKFSDFLVAYIDRNDVPVHSSRPATGYLGSSLFAGSTLTIDYPRKKLIVERSRGGQPQDPASVPMKLIDGTPYVAVQVENQTIWMLVDTGYDGGILIPNAAALGLQYEKAPVPVFLTQVIGGETARPNAARLRTNIKFGEYEFERPIIQSSSSYRYPIVGYQFLKHFAITFDFRNKRAIFRREAKGPVETPPWRQVLIAGRDAEGKVKIADIAPGSDAERFGLRVNDEIVSFNGTPADKLDDESFKAALADGSHCSFEIKREGQRSKIDFIPTAIVP